MPPLPKTPARKRAKPAKPGVPTRVASLTLFADDIEERDDTRTESAAVLGFQWTAGTFAPHGIWDYYLSGNPFENIQEIAARSSTVAALGLVYVQSQGLYDMLDELVDRDIQIGSCLAVQLSRITAFERRFEVEDEEDVHATEIRDACEKYLDKDLLKDGLEATIRTLAEGSIRHGFSVNEIVWEVRDGYTVPKRYVHRHPGLFAFTATGVLHVIDPSGAPIPAPPGKFAVMTWGGLYGNPYGSSVLFSVRWIATFKRGAMKRWDGYIELFGTPLAVGTIDPTATNGRDRVSNMKSIFRNLTATAGVVLDGGDKIEFVKRGEGSSGAAPHENFVKYCDDAIATAIMGNTLTTRTGSVGSLALGEVHERTSQSLAADFAKAVEATIQSQIVVPFVRMNFGPEAPVPRFVIDTDDARDVEEALKIVDLAHKLGIPMTLAQVWEWLGIIQPQDGEELLGKASPISPNESAALEEARRIAEDEDDDEPLDAKRFAELRKKYGLDKPRPQRGGPRRPFGEAGVATEAALATHRKFLERGDDLARLLAFEAREALAEAVANALAPLEVRDRDEPVAEDDADTIAESLVFNITDSLSDALLAGRALACLLDAELYAATLTARFDGKYADGAVAFDDDLVRTIAAVKAALERMGVGLKEQTIILELAEALGEEIGSGIGQRVLAIDASVSEVVRGKIRDALKEAHAKGLTYGDFIERIDALSDEGLMPAGLDGYMEMVYRTELSNEYAAQRDRLEALPEIADYTWGYEFFNPDDDRSRPGHARMDGVIVKRGGAADIASRPGPPWHYQCRCARAAIVVGSDEEAAEYSETDDALARVLMIERWND